MEPYYQSGDEQVTLYQADCLDALRQLPDASVDSVVCDPPYALPGGFMGKSWDQFDGREDPSFAYWLAGLIDGEGCFLIKEHSRGTHAPAFALKMRGDEKGTLEMIRRRLGIGSINVETKHPHLMVKWIVQDKAGCQRLVDLLDKYPLRAKKRMDYRIWREAVCEWSSRPRGNRWHGAADNTHMASLRGRLMEGRAYTYPAWSGHEFQDWCRLWAAECLRVLKPGGHLVAFGAARTYHRLACAIEDAGFDIRDSLHWIYGSGFPKSLDVSKAIDQAGGASPVEQARVLRAARERAGLSREQVAEQVGCTASSVRDWEEGRARAVGRPVEHIVPSPQYRAKLADLLGYSADERIVVGIGGGSRGLYDTGHRGVQYGTATTDRGRSWVGWGTALKPAHEPIVLARKPLAGTVAATVLEFCTGAINVDACQTAAGDDYREKCASVVGLASNRNGATLGEWAGVREDSAHPAGRWPTNILLAHGEACLEGGACQPGCPSAELGDEARFFPVFRYEAKAPKSERPRLADGTVHTTVKPLALMRWLVRLVTPPNGVVLDPFAGSGTTLEAAVTEGFRAIGVELLPEHADLCVQRLSKPITPVLFGETA